MNDLELCESCNTMKHGTRTAYVNSKYYRHICNNCLGGVEDEVSSIAAGHARRRQYEDHAADTVQPYDGNGKPNLEFFRLYPNQAKKMFSAKDIEDLKRKI